MRVLSLGEFPINSPRAHAVNVFKTSGGFARLGHEVTVGCLPPDGSGSAPDLGLWFGEPVVRAEVFERGAYGAAAAARARSMRADVVYARSFQGALACAEAGFATVLETHAHPGDANPLIGKCCASAREYGVLRGIVTIGAVLRDAFIGRGASPSRVHIVPDGVDLDLFTPPADPPPPPWPQDGRRQAVYAGHLYEYKGVPTVLDAASAMHDWAFHLVGGVPEDIERVRESIRARRLTNVTLHGHRPHTDVPRWLWAADALLLPPLASDPSAHWTSPVKLGEYLAAGPPVIASDIPSLGDWVDERQVIWFRAGDSSGLVEALRCTSNEPPERKQRRKAAALERARTYSYSNRAARILRIAEGKETA